MKLTKTEVTEVEVNPLDLKSFMDAFVESRTVYTAQIYQGNRAGSVKELRTKDRTLAVVSGNVRLCKPFEQFDGAYLGDMGILDKKHNNHLTFLSRQEAQDYLDWAINGGLPYERDKYKTFYHTWYNPSGRIV